MNGAEFCVKKDCMCVINVAKGKANNVIWYIGEPRFAHSPKVFTEFVHIFFKTDCLDTICSQLLPVCPVETRTAMRWIAPRRSGRIVPNVRQIAQ